MLQKFALHFKDMSSAIDAITSSLEMQQRAESILDQKHSSWWCRAVDGTLAIGFDDSASQHNLHLVGTFIGDVLVLARAQVRMDEKSGCVLKLSVRSSMKEVSEIVADCIK